MKRRIVRIGQKGKGKLTAKERELSSELDVRVAMIQALIPIGLEAVAKELEREVEFLAGKKYSRDGGLPGYYRWGRERRSVYLADQKVRTSVPRVRDAVKNKEVSLRSLELLQEPRRADEGVLRRILLGLSCRDYEGCAEAVPEAFGLSPSTISRRFIKASSKKLKQLMERDLSKRDFVAMFIDGKSFAEDEMIIALGVTMDGEKVVLGFVQSGTENERVMKDFLNSLIDRGLNVERGLLCVIDGSKGLYSGIKKVFRDKVLIQRCQWHKRENVVSYLPKAMQDTWRRKLQRAYEKPKYEEAKAELRRLKNELMLINRSAASSLEEGLEETLTLHRLGLFEVLGKSLKTTNCLESLMSLIEAYTAKVDYWKNSSQKHRWVASAVIEIEPRLRKVRGYRWLPMLREEIRQHLDLAREAA
jgi:transposase-like protein